MDAIGNLLKRTRCERGDHSQRKENLFFQSQMDESKPLENIKTSEHPFRRKVTLIFLENQKGLFHNLTTHFRMPLKQLMISDLCQETSYAAESKLPEKIRHWEHPPLIRPRPNRREGHIDFHGESEGSFPQPYDSHPVAGEAMHDFWSMSGGFIYRHHVDLRVKLYSSRKESFLVPLKYINVSRTTHTNLDVKQEKRIDDYWNIDGSRDLSDPWTGFTQFTPIGRKISRRIYVVPVEKNVKTANIRARSFMIRNLEINGEARQAEGESKSGRM